MRRQSRVVRRLDLRLPEVVEVERIEVTAADEAARQSRLAAWLRAGREAAPSLASVLGAGDPPSDRPATLPAGRGRFVSPQWRDRIARWRAADTRVITTRVAA